MSNENGMKYYTIVDDFIHSYSFIAFQTQTSLAKKNTIKFFTTMTPSLKIFNQINFQVCLLISVSSSQNRIRIHTWIKIGLVNLISKREIG